MDLGYVMCMYLQISEVCVCVCGPTLQVHVLFLTSWLITPVSAANGREEKIGVMFNINYLVTKMKQKITN